MRLRNALLVALLAVPLLAVGAGTKPAAAEDATFDVSFFYDRLAPYGDWVSLEGYGWVWVPQAAECVECGWRPYTAGYWAYAEPYGWLWVSTEDWGWATYHYGRWLYTDDYGWVWVPGTVWAPAWVSFRYGNGYVGWAPLPPTPRWRYDSGVDGIATVESSIGSYAWAFVQARWFGDPDLNVRYVNAVHNPWLYSTTTGSTRLVANGDVVVNRSVDLALVERARGRAVVRYRPSDAADPERARVRGRIEGDSIPVFRARIAPTAPKKAPTARVAKTLSPGDVDDLIARRRIAMKAHLDAQRAALEKDPDDAFVPADTPPAGRTQPPPANPPGAKPPPANPPGAQPPDAPPARPSAEEIQKRREAAKKALEEEQKRLERLLERQRKNLEHKDGPPDAPPPPKEKDKDKKDKKDKDDKDGMDG